MRERSRCTYQDGASAVEYSLIVTAIAAILVLIIFVIGGFTRAMFNDTCSNLSAGSYQSSTGSCP